MKLIFYSNDKISSVEIYY